MNNLYILMGCPGSGKSTFAKTVFNTPFYVSRDDIRFSLINENEDYFSKENEVFKIFTSTISKYLNEGNNRDVMADATHLNKNSRTKLLYNLNVDFSNITISIIYIKNDLLTCLKQNENRKGTKFFVPEDALKNMYGRIEEPSFFEKGWNIDNIYIYENKILKRIERSIKRR